MKCGWAASILPLVLAPCAIAADRTPVEVWRGGDDGLTIRFSESLENGFRVSPGFVLSGKKTAESLVVTIPTNLRWEMVGNRLRFDYNVEFKTSLSGHVGGSKGACWEDEMPICAKHIIEEATRFIAH